MMENSEERAVFTREMKNTHTILVPSMLPVHFGILKELFEVEGYRMEILENEGQEVIQTGLKYVHNDTCYPALLVIGQMINALESGRYDIDKTALLITQTGGGCRASNYIFLLRKALKKAGLGHVPVISLNAKGFEANPGFTISPGMLTKAVPAITFGDEIMLLANQVRPYELNKGDTDKLVKYWTEEIRRQLDGFFTRTLPGSWRLMIKIAKSFEKIPVSHENKVKVGIVGEIYVKYAGLGNNHLEEFLQSQDVEYMLPGLMGFLAYGVSNSIEENKLYGGNNRGAFGAALLLKYFSIFESAMINAVNKTRFLPPERFKHTKELAKGIISYGSTMGEGWLLTAEMLELVECGYENIICAQPFGCLPNHINGRGMLNRIKEHSPKANIVAVDYDPSAAKVNQENRIKLMLAAAREKMQAENRENAYNN